MTTVDARGLACPLPLTLARRRMSEVAPGEVLTVLVTDPEAPIDLGAWAADEGHTLRELAPAAEGAFAAPEGWVTLEVRKAS